MCFPLYLDSNSLKQAEEIARKWRVSEVARGKGGWFYLFKKSKYNNGNELINGQPALQVRSAFLARHTALPHPYVKDGIATRHLISLLMWHFSPLPLQETKKLIQKTYDSVFSPKSAKK